MGIVIAFLWGLAEATVFFIVPDVFLSWIALSDKNKALLASLSATLGAIIGGVIIYIFAYANVSPVEGFLVQIPAIDSQMVDQVNREIRDSGLISIFTGPLKGVPYKIYASAAGASGLSFLFFIMISIPARLFRFLIVSLVTSLFIRHFFSSKSLQEQRIVLAVFWIVFYLYYFIHFGL